MTGGPVTAGLLFKDRDIDRTARRRDGTARMERAAGGRVNRARHIAGQNDTLTTALPDLCDRYRREQRFGVWMQGAVVDVRGCSKFYHLAEVHDTDPVADVRDDGQIMRH